MDGQADKLVGQHAAAAQAGRAVVVIADGDVGARTDVVVGVVVKVTERAGVLVALQIAAHLVVAVTEAVGKQAALGVQQQASRLHGAAGDDDDVGKLLLQMTVGIEVGNAAGAAAIVGQNLLRHALGAQLAVAGAQRDGNDGVLRAVFSVHLAGKSTAPAAAHAGAAAVIGHAVARHGNVEGMQPEALGGRLQGSQIRD